MIFVFGLGNPGKEYEQTRHNAGQMAAEQLAERVGVSLREQSKLHARVGKSGGLVIAVPTTYMNNSGQAIRAVLDFYKHDPRQTDEIVVLHDDLDIALGTYKLVAGSGPKQHNGLLSTYEHLGTEGYWHGRIGVDGRQGNRQIPGKEYVLQPFLAEEQSQLDKVITELTDQLLTIAETYA